MTGDFNLKYLPQNLLDAYNYDLSQCEDNPELSEPLINISTVLQAHYILAHYFTDDSADSEIEKMLVGVRSFDLLSSALCRQIVSFDGRRKYSDNIDICSTLFFGLTKNHAFHDGNKRTALLILLYQLSLFGYYPKQELKQFEDLVLAVADSKLSEKYEKIYKKFKKTPDAEIYTISYILRRLTEKKDRQIHLNMTMNDFCDVLSERGVEWVLDNNKIKFSRVKLGLFRKPLTYIVKFYGWTRAVETGMVRDTLNALELVDEYSSINNIFNGKPSFYKLINQFEIPLRRLKDE